MGLSKQGFSVPFKGAIGFSSTVPFKGLGST